MEKSFETRLFPEIFYLLNYTNNSMVLTGLEDKTGSVMNPFVIGRGTYALDLPTKVGK
jgi:hypothetical protein